MEVIFATLALAISICSGVVTVLLYLHRENTSEFTSKVRALELETADLVDRLSVWQRRDASRQRKVGSDVAPVEPGLQPDQHGTMPDTKLGLRAVARQRGLIK